MLFIYYILIAAFTLYSYVLVDPSLTLINHPLWASFRDVMVQIGFHNRELSWNLFALLVLGMFGFHFYFLRNSKHVNPVSMSIVIGLILLMSYPFLSRDLFNYMFDARILTVHGQNPYFHAANEFQNDHWLRFMHWTHRAYPYGPSFLPITLIPSAAAFGKFILNLIFFKAVFVGFYLAAVYYMNKLNQKWALFLATNPLVLIEGLVNAHNDLIAVSLAVIGLAISHKVIKNALFILSIGIKYITFPVVLLQKKSAKWQQYLALAGITAVIGYLSLSREIHAWYFLNFLVFLPFFDKLIYRSQLFVAGLIFSYYPFIRLGEWVTQERIELKHTIILYFTAANIAYYVFIYTKDRRLQKAQIIK